MYDTQKRVALAKERIAEYRLSLIHILIVFSFLTLTLTGLYTAQGDSKTPFMANLIGLMTNMILDPVLILGPGPFPRLGVTGAAIATVTALSLIHI